MAKSTLPMIAIAGAALVLLMPKKKATAKSGSGATSDPNVVMSGASQGWDWQVVKAQRPGFAAEYAANVKPAPAATWTEAGRHSSPSTAKAIALEYILDNTPVGP